MNRGGSEMSHKVLIVEDDLDINNLLVNILKNEAFSVVSSFSGTEALLQFAHNNFDIVLVDLMIPGLSGDEVIKQIRETSNVPIIVISAKECLK